MSTEAGEIEGAGVLLAWRSQGNGPAVVCVHGLFAAPAPLDLLAAGGVRAVAYDRRGHGGSGAPEPYTGTTVSEQAEDLAALLRGLALAPVVLLAEGFGALIALDMVARHREQVAGVVLVDPPLHAFVPEATEVLGTERLALQEALRLGGPDAPSPASLADFAGLASWPVTRRELRELDAPAVLVTSEATPDHVRAGAEALAGLLPDVRGRTDGDGVAAALELAL